MCVSTSCASLCELASQVVYPYYFVDQPVPVPDPHPARPPPPPTARTGDRGGRAPRPVPRCGAAPHAGADNAYITTI